MRSPTGMTLPLTDKEDLYNTYREHLPQLYEPKIETPDDENGKDAIITVTFTRRGDLPAVLVWMDFPPANIPMLEYRMKLEKDKY